MTQMERMIRFTKLIVIHRKRVYIQAEQQITIMLKWR